MSQPIKYKEKYEEAKKLYLNGYSLTKISKELHIDRGCLSENLKKDGIEVINKQNEVKFNNKFFDKIDTEEKAYWLGFLYADGAVSSGKRNVIELSLKSSDIHHLEKFRDSLGYSKDKHIFQDDIRCRIECTDKHLKESLIKLGCVPQKSLILKFPTEDQVPREFLFHFIRGYIDGDGSVMIALNYKKERVKPRLNILGTENFLLDLIKETGWKERTIYHPSGAYSVDWCGKYVMEYLDQIYLNASIYLDRKYEKYLILKNIQ